MHCVAMSQGRFEFLLNCLRFNDPDTWQERQKADKFAPVREIWDIFIEICGKMYISSENLTVDEQLLAFRGRCPFCMFIPNKAAKYGIKIVLANDSKSKYLVGAIPYLGKQVTKPSPGVNLGHYFTKELTKPYHRTNRNVTTLHYTCAANNRSFSQLWHESRGNNQEEQGGDTHRDESDDQSPSRVKCILVYKDDSGVTHPQDAQEQDKEGTGAVTVFCTHTANPWRHWQAAGDRVLQCNQRCR